MSKRPSNEHPIQGYFAKAIHDSLTDQLGLEPDDHVEAYLTEMLVNFLHGDRIYAIRDAEGRRVETVAAKSTGTLATFCCFGPDCFPNSYGS